MQYLTGVTFAQMRDYRLCRAAYQSEALDYFYTAVIWTADYTGCLVRVLASVGMRGARVFYAVK